MKNADKPIYPIINKDGFPTYESALSDRTDDIIGLTKREYFAAMAMQGLCTDANEFRPTYYSGDYDHGYPLLAEHAVKIADALLAELEKEQK